MDLVGRAGGLALLWMADVDIHLRSTGTHFIDVLMKEEGGMSWRLTGIYGWSKSSNKMKMWELLRQLGGHAEMAWMLTGNFSEVLYETEKNSRNPCDYNSV